MAQPASVLSNDLRSHPAADVFPLMGEADLAALADDIRKNGQRDAIVLLNGSILDGRNRWLAAQKLGHTPITEEWDGIGTPLDFVVSKNLHRRHLNLSQRAMIACQIATAEVGGDRMSDHRIQISDGPNVTADQAAKMLGVSRALVIRAKTIWQRGTEQEIEAVRSGDAKVSRTVFGIWQREREKRRPVQPATIIPFPQSRRCPPKLPDGQSPEFVARKAIALYQEMKSADRVADALGIRRHRCRQMMDIVLIADRGDLSLHDTSIAAAALAAMNEQSVPLEAICQTIAPIMRRLWGDRKGNSRTARENNRTERFEHGIGILIQSCLNGGKIEVPHLSPLHAKDVLSELRDAIESVRVLITRIEEMHR
jgi:hypothetical protein